MKILAISDLHGQFPILTQDADVLVVAGDLTIFGNKGEVYMFNSWLKTLPYEHKVVIAGNHDKYLQDRNHKNLLTNAHYLEDSGVEIDGIKFWGSPWTVKFGQWSFMKHDVMLDHCWNKIPDDTDVLITHGPPYGILDTNEEGRHCGSQGLRRRIFEVMPSANIFGHIHEAYGKEILRGVQFANCSLLNRSYDMVNEPCVIEIKGNPPFHTSALTTVSPLPLELEKRLVEEWKKYLGIRETTVVSNTKKEKNPAEKRGTQRKH